jgi:hypothetical protein
VGTAALARAHDARILRAKEAERIIGILVAMVHEAAP